MTRICTSAAILPMQWGSYACRQLSNLDEAMENSFKITEHIEVFGQLHQVTVTVWLMPDGDWDYRVCHSEHDITLEVNRFDAELIEKKIQKCLQKKRKL